MIFKEIEAIYTKKVAEYIANGYTFNCNTMAGHQGEIAKVDLRKGKEIVRILFVEEHCYDEHMTDKYVILIGRNTEVHSNRRYDIIWNNHLETIERIEFFRVTENYAVASEEEYKAIIEKRRNRRRSHNREYSTLANDAYSKIVLSFVKRQAGCKRCKVSDIKVTKVINRCDNYTEYFVIANGKSFRLK